jgi:hypothetical protein
MANTDIIYRDTHLAYNKDNVKSYWSEGNVWDAINKNEYLRMVNVVDELPTPENVRSVLNERMGICKDRSPRIILVESIEDYMVFITIPDGKSECDFRVWRYSPKLEPKLKIPTHNDQGALFLRLKSKHQLIDEYLINATIKLLKGRLSVSKIIQYYFEDLEDSLKNEIKKFLVTLKWIGLQEDVNYPPPKYIGSKMGLAVYALLEAGFQLSELRRVLRFR